jgi:hypothetical protein
MSLVGILRTFLKTTRSLQYILNTIFNNVNVTSGHTEHLLYNHETLCT